MGVNNHDEAHRRAVEEFSNLIDQMLVPDPGLQRKVPLEVCLLVRMTKDEIRLCWTEILPQGSEDYGDLFPLEDWVTPDGENDDSYGEWFRRAIRYTQFVGGHDFEALGAFPNGAILPKRGYDTRVLEPRNELYFHLLANHKMPVENSIRRAIEFTEERGLLLPLNEMKAFEHDVLSVIEWAKRDTDQDQLDAALRQRAKAVAALGIVVPGFEDVEDVN